MKKRRTRTASAAELKRLKPKKKFNVHDETKKLLNTFLPFPNEDPIHFMSPDEVVAVDFGGIIKRTTAGKIAEAVANHKKPGILGRLDPEKVLTDDVKAKIKSSFDNILFSPNKEPVDLPPYQQPTSYTFELKPTDVFNITVDGRELNMSGQTLREAFEARIAHDEKKFYTAMDNLKDFKRFRVQMNDEVVLIVPEDKGSISIKGREILDAIEQKDQVENLRQEAEALTNWKNSVLEVLAKWNDVQDYLMKKVDGKTWGRSVAEVALERLKDYDHFIGKMNATKTTSEVRQVINEREPTPEEIVEAFLRQLEGRESYYPFVLEAINSRLITQLQRVAEMATETSAIARKRFEESISILQRVSPPNKH